MKDFHFREGNDNEALYAKLFCSALFKNLLVRRKRFMKKITFLLSLAVFAFSLAMVQAAPVEMKLSHFGAESHPSQAAAKMFAEGVEKRTNGQVKIVIYPNN
jgi:hypothetical protein